jgi:hypothetical protein
MVFRVQISTRGLSISCLDVMNKLYEGENENGTVKKWGVVDL